MVRIVVRVLFIIGGLILFGIDFRCYVKKKLNEGVSLIWMLLSVLMVIMGAANFCPSFLLKENMFGMVVSFLFFYGMVIQIFYVSIIVSKLAFQNRELAMQVSLLNYENQQMMIALKKLSSGDEFDEKKDSVCN